MARIRSVHPSLFTDEAWVSCSPLARLLYIGLWTDADDQGVFEWKPLQIKMRLLPGDTADVTDLLKELRDAALIAPFDHDRKLFGAIRNFRRFQRPKKPNSVHVLPDDFRTYVGLEAGGSEQEADEGEAVPHHFPTSGEKSPQMEDGGGGEGEGKEEKPPVVPQVAPTRASRLPGDWQPTDIDRAYAYSKGFGPAAVETMAERFRNYWTAMSGAKAAKLDWSATWRNWVINDAERTAAKIAQPKRVSFV